MVFQQDSRSSVALDEEAVRNAGVSWDEATEGKSRPTDQLGANFATRRYRDIHFSVKRKIWRQDDQGMESADAEYKAKRESVLVKGGGKCVFRVPLETHRGASLQ